MNPDPRTDPDETISPDDAQSPNWEALEQKVELNTRNVTELTRISDGRYNFLCSQMSDIKAMVERVLVRVGRLDKEGDVTVSELRDLRRAFRDSKPQMLAPATNANGEFFDMTQTAKTRALTQRDADLMLANQELERLRAGAAERVESRKYWGRQIINWLALITIGIVVGYGVYRTTRPATSLTIESKGAPSK